VVAAQVFNRFDSCWPHVKRWIPWILYAAVLGAIMSTLADMFGNVLVYPH
jgi:hypothetical protein